MLSIKPFLSVKVFLHLGVGIFLIGNNLLGTPSVSVSVDGGYYGTNYMNEHNSITITVTFVSVEIYVNFIRSRKSLKNEAYNSDAKFTCPYCSQRVEVPNSLFGQMISCPTCEKDFRASGIAERDGRTVTVRKNS